MPTVPVVDQTAMNPQPYAAPGTTPMRNDAPQQLLQSGQALQQAGAVATKTGQTIGDALHAQVDDAKVAQATVAAAAAEQDINHNAETGFMNLKGQDAIDGYAAAGVAVKKAYQDRYDALDNDLQKYRFNQVREQQLPAIGAKMSTHVFQQTSQMSGEAAISASNLGAASATYAYKSYGKVDADGNPVGDFEENLSAAEQATLTAVHVLKGAPPDSAIAREALLNLHTQVGTGVLSQMMNSRAPAARVQSVFDDLNAKGMLDLRAQDSLGGFVRKYTEQENNRSVINQQLSDAVRSSQGQPTSSTGTPDYQFAIKGASIVAQPYDPDKGTVTVNAPNGSNIQAPADGKVLGILEDGKGGLGVQIQHSDGSVSSFYGLNATGVKVGEKVQRGEDIGSGAGAVQWSLADKNGTMTDPTKAGLGPVDLTKVTDEKVLAAALDGVRKQITDPDQQQAATSELESFVRHNQSMANTAAMQNFKSASEDFYNGGMQWRNIKPTTFNQLTAEQQQHFKDEQTQHVLTNYEQGQRFREMSQTDIVSDFITNPDMVTPANVESARPKLANSTYLQLMRQAQDQQNDPDKLLAARVDMTRLKYFANQSGLPIYSVSARLPGNKEQFAALSTSVQDAVNAEQIAKKRQLTQDEKDVIMKRQLTQQTLHTLRSPNNPMAILPSWLGGNPVQSVESPYTFQLPKDSSGNVMPDAVGRKYVIEKLAAGGISKPTEDQIGRYYREALKH